MHDAVAVALEGVARGRWGFSKPSTSAVRRVAGQRRQAGMNGQGTHRHFQ
jgi:hypothetical protein